jgi:hypothetical protein
LFAELLFEYPGVLVDFVAARGFSLAAASSALRGAAVGWAGERGFELHRFGSIELFASDSMSLNRIAPRDGEAACRAYYLFDGEFSARERFFHPLVKCSTVQLRRNIELLLHSDQMDQEIDAGVFVAGRIDRNGLKLLTDPLSQYPIYYFCSDERFVVSNVLQQIVAVLVASGLKVTPSVVPCIEGTLLGGVLGDLTHVSEIRRLPFGHVIVADPHLRLRRRQCPNRELPYEQTIVLGRAALERHFQAVAAAVAEPRLIATDLTGGSHSRLVLSLLLDSPLRKEVKAVCTTRYPHVDANVAGALMSKYDLPIASLPAVVGSTSGFSARNHIFKMNAAFTGGARQLGPTLQTVAFPNFVHFTGNFGEIGGATPSIDFVAQTMREGYSPSRAVDIMLSRRQAEALQFINKEGINLVRRNAITTLIALEEEGIPRDHFPAELYLRSRCRTHFGLPNWLSNKGRIKPDPLASLWLVEARRKLPRALHSKNKVILDLILLGTSRELALMPMADKVWDPTIVPPANDGSYRIDAAAIVTHGFADRSNDRAPQDAVTQDG